jgi:Xaa-Pro dipeptidase
VNLEAIQNELNRLGLDGWLFFDHHRRDPLAYRILGFEPVRIPTRRWYYFIPAVGEPSKLVHRIEREMLDPLHGAATAYSGWSEQVDGLRRALGSSRRVAMQYSPLCAIPYVSMVDGGTVDLIRSLGVEVVSSADLIQLFEARLTPAALESHLEAGRRVDRIRAEAFALIGERLRSGAHITEFEVKQFILSAFARTGLVTDHGPIVGVNANASNPHYEPTADRSSEIRPADLVLIDMWAKLDQPGSIYYDITWTGFCGDVPPPEMRRVFEIVSGARDAAIRLVKNSVSTGRTLQGFEVDDAARGFIEEAAFGQYFVHRTGHSIGEDVHGSGANMDNLETHDERQVMPWTLFSIEPGIYLPEFGIRAEVNVFAGDDAARVTGEVQAELLAL